MTSPIYNPATERFITRVIDDLPQALLLEGPVGVGLLTIAKSIAWRDLAAIVQPTNAKGETDLSAKGIIRIPQIRELIGQTRSKFTSRQVIIIDDADKMNAQTQNAFLKLLEEPAPNIHFVLTAHNSQTLLPTVLSRVQRITIRPISSADSKRFVAKLGVNDERKIQQLLFLASGKPAKLYRLVTDETYFAEQAAMIADARTFIQGKPYDQTLVVSRYYSDRSKTLELLALAETIIRFSLPGNPSQTLIATADRLADTYEHILANGNTRLQLMNFVVQ